MGREYESSTALTDDVTFGDQKGNRYYRKSQVIAWVVLVIIVAAVVGVLCGILPECITPVEEPIIGTLPPPGEKTTPPPVEPTQGPGEPTQGPGEPTDEPMPPTTPPVCMGDWCELRLPESLQADHYILRLTPDLDQETFEGDVTIEISVTKNMNNPRFHYK